MNNLFKKLGLINDDEKMSITNSIVIIFVLILAFKMLFAGVIIYTKLFDWKILEPDVASTLPLLFGLLNYGHRRFQQNLNDSNNTNQTKEETK